MFTSRLAPPNDIIPFIVRVVAGATLVAVSISKFTKHATLVDSFERYSVPAPEISVYVAGAVELIGGLLLLAGFLVRPAGVVIAVQFVVAIATGGRVDTDLYHVGLGGLLLAAGAFLAWSGAGRWSVDERIAARSAGPAVQR
jgi:putative oxidoreductase